LYKTVAPEPNPNPNMMDASQTDSRLILDTVERPYIRLDKEFRFTSVNRAAEAFFGRTQADLIGRTPWEVDPNAGTPLERGFRRALAERIVVGFDYCHEPSHRWHRVNATPDKASGLVVEFSDIVSSRRNAHATLFDSTHEGVALYKLTFAGDAPADYIILDVNPRYEEIVGMTRQDLTNKLATEVFHAQEAPYLREYSTAVHSQSASHFEAYFQPMDKHISISVIPMGDELFATIVFDITKQKKTATLLRDSQDKFARAFRSNPAAITITDLRDASYLEVNGTFEHLTGYRRDEVVGKTWDELAFWTDPPVWNEALTALLKDGTLRSREIAFRKKSGDVGTGLLSAELIDIGGHQCAITAIMDITERLHLQSQLLQSQKLESVGRLAGGVAHDFNNLLTVITGYAGFLFEAFNSNDPQREFIDEIRRAAERAASLTHQLLAFSRRQIIAPKPLNLNNVIQDAQRMLQRLIREDIELVSKLDPLLGPVLADANQFNQVIMNLVINAGDAMPQGGKLVIKTTTVDVDEDIVAEHPEAASGRHVLITVSDTGTGMSVDVLRNIFDPFFTTKSPGRGTGLGLSTVYGIVRQSGGWIEVSSRVGQGSEFRIYLPQIAAIPTEESVASTVNTGRLHGSETVLLVEDEVGVRRLTETILGKYGYHVLEAANGADAITIAKKHFGEIHLLLADMILPGVNGKELFEKLRNLRPGLRVLFMSGYADNVIVCRSALDPGLDYIPKPFGPEALVTKIRAVLGQGSQASAWSG
jgi:two-component system, cell cycle sensor histidine kinase and response regulator CckA